jgi:transposase
MAKGYRPVRRDQPFLLPPDMREWLPAGHAVWLVIEAVGGHLDTSAFHARRRTGGPGTAGYDPDMLVTLLVWAYAQGVTSSRRIEAACWQDVSFRVICAGDVPDHVTIARFRAAFPGAVQDLFTEVLVLCARLGMGRLGTVALDGMKIAASASAAANRTEETLRKLAAEQAARAVAAHAAADQAEDELLGGGRRGDEVPPQAAAPGSRAARIAAALADLEAERAAAEQAARQQEQAFWARQQAGAPGAPPAGIAVQAARARLERARAQRAAQLADLEARAAGPVIEGSRRDRPRAGIEDYCLVRAAREALEKAEARAAGAAARAAGRTRGRGPVRNITDPDSRLMPVRGGGFIQGYNAQNVTSEDGLIIATALANDPVDWQWFEPMLRRAEAAARLLAGHRPGRHNGGGIGLVLADAGYCSEANLTTSGPDRLIATGKLRDLGKAARGGEAAGRQRARPATIAMAERLKTADGLTAYHQRGHIAETPHGHIKHNMRFRQLSVRGNAKAAAEWTFTAAVHNLFKAITSGHLTTQALATLAA